MTTVAVGERARQDVDEFRAWMLEARKYFALVSQGNKERFEGLPGAALCGEEMIGVAATRATSYDLQTQTRRHSLRTFLFTAHALKQDGRPHTEGGGERDQSF